MFEAMKQSVTATLLLTLCLTGCGEDQAYQPTDPPVVTVATPVVQRITEYREFTGTLEAAQTEEVRARVNGFLEHVHFEPGTLVTPETKLYTIEQGTFQARLDSAQAALDAAEASVTLRQTTLDRLQQAFERGAATDYEILTATAERDAALAERDGAQANLQQAQIDFDYTEIYPTISGQISETLIDEGNLVGQGEPTLLCTVVRRRPIYAYFNATERDLSQYLRRLAESGEEYAAVEEHDWFQAFLTLADGYDYPIAGTVDYGDNRVDPDTGTTLIRATFDNEDGTLYPGFFVRIRIPQPEREAMLVPEAAVQRDITGYYVLTVKPGEDNQQIVHRTGIEVGGTIDGQRIVESGLEGTEQVIVNGLQRAIPGSSVTPQPAEGGQTQPQADANEGDTPDAE